MWARDNPFAVQRVLEIRYRLSGATLDELMEGLAALRFRAAIVGPHGSGKTTLLEDLGCRLAQRGFRLRTATLHTGDRRLSASRRSALFQDLTPSEILLLDGAEQLGRFAWLEVRARSRAAAGLVITSHHPGLLPTLYECRTTPELLDEILCDLLGDRPEAPPADLFARHGGNLREALREMYDVYARKEAENCESPSSPGGWGGGWERRGWGGEGPKRRSSFPSSETPRTPLTSAPVARIGSPSPAGR